MAAKSARASSSARSRPWKPSGPMQLISSITPRQRSRKRTGMATMDCVSIMVFSSTLEKKRVSLLTSGTITFSPCCATQPAMPCPTLMRMSLRACAPLPTASSKWSSCLASSTSSSDQVSGRRNSSIFSMMVRRTWSSWRDEVSALPSSWKTATSPASRWFTFTAELRRRSTPLKLLVSSTVRLNLHPLVRPRPRARWGAIAIISNVLCGAQPAVTARFRKAQSQLVQAVQRGHLISLSKSGVIEDRVAEIFDRGAQGKHRLADVDNLRGARADDMNAQKLEALGIEQELQQALLIAEHLALGQLGVLGDARLVGYFRRGQLLLGLTDNGGDQHFTVDPLAALQLGKDPITLLLDANCDYLLAEPECGSKIAQVVVESFHDLTVHKVQEARALIDERNLDAHHRKNGGVLHADHSSAHHNCLPRQPLKRVKLISVQDPFAVEWNIGTMGRPGSARDQDVITSEESRAAIGHHLDRMGVNEACGAFKRGHFVAFQLRPDDFGFPSHDSLNAESQVLHRHVLSRYSFARRRF